MSNSFNAARVFLKSFSFLFVLNLMLFFFSSCNLESKKSSPKPNTFSHVLPISIQEKNSHLIDCQKNNIKNSLTKKSKDSTKLIELALEDHSKPIMTFVQYSY
jgi:hypothetical protein